MSKVEDHCHLTVLDAETFCWGDTTLCGLSLAEEIFIGIEKDPVKNAASLMGPNGECPEGCRLPRCQQCLRVATNEGWFDRELVESHHKGRS